MTNIPVGAVIAFAGALAPTAKQAGDPQTVLEATGWMACDGRFLKAAEYYEPFAFAVLGYRYGGSDESFGIPNLPPSETTPMLSYIICCRRWS